MGHDVDNLRYEIKQDFEAIRDEIRHENRKLSEEIAELRKIVELLRSESPRYRR